MVWPQCLYIASAVDSRPDNKLRYPAQNSCWVYKYAIKLDFEPLETHWPVILGLNKKYTDVFIYFTFFSDQANRVSFMRNKK